MNGCAAANCGAGRSPAARKTLRRGQNGGKTSKKTQCAKILQKNVCNINKIFGLTLTYSEICIKINEVEVFEIYSSS